MLNLTFTLTYGDPSPAVRDAIGDDLAHLLNVFFPSVTIFCDRFTGQGSWTDDSGTTYSEHSGNIVGQIPTTQLGRTLYSLRQLAFDTALRHNQDAIGVIYSTDSDTLVRTTGA